MSDEAWMSELRNIFDGENFKGDQIRAVARYVLTHAARFRELLGMEPEPHTVTVAPTPFVPDPIHQDPELFARTHFAPSTMLPPENPATCARCNQPMVEIGSPIFVEGWGIVHARCPTITESLIQDALRIERRKSRVPEARYCTACGFSIVGTSAYGNPTMHQECHDYTQGLRRV